MSQRQAMQLGKKGLGLGVLSAYGLLLASSTFCFLLPLAGVASLSRLGLWFVRERKCCHSGQDKLHVLGSGGSGGGGSGGGSSVMRLGWGQEMCCAEWKARVSLVFGRVSWQIFFFCFLFKGRCIARLLRRFFPFSCFALFTFPIFPSWACL
ncbi:hypothetical protein VTG60DRAFT_1654 [Thermothelomyces hinnuleus]